MKAIRKNKRWRLVFLKKDVPVLSTQIRNIVRTDELHPEAMSKSIVEHSIYGTIVERGKLFKLEESDFSLRKSLLVSWPSTPMGMSLEELARAYTILEHS